MCRALGSKTPRRCPNCTPRRRRAFQKARYAIKKARKVRNALITPVEAPVAAGAVAGADLNALIESVKIAAGGVFREDHKGESLEENLAFQRLRQEACRGLGDKYGSLDKAAIAVGGLVAARAEELSGTSAEQVKARYEERLRKAEGDYMGAVMTSPQEERVSFKHLVKVKRGTDPETLSDMRGLANSYQAALAEIRPMGGEIKLHARSDPQAAALIQDAAELYPTEWIEASNGHSLLVASATTKRAHYADWHDIRETEQARRMEQVIMTPDRSKLVTVGGPEGELRDTGRTAHEAYRDRKTGEYVDGHFPVYEREQWEVFPSWKKFRAKKDGSPWGKGSGWEKWEDPESERTAWRRPAVYDRVLTSEVGSEILTGGRTISYIEGREANFAVSAHEFGHRTEEAVDGVMNIERSFLERRTSNIPSKDWPGTMEQDPLIPMSPGSNEMTRPDSFTNIYMGRDYTQGATEVMSMGMEGIFAGNYGGFIGIGGEKPDLEVRDLVLGVLASAGGTRERGQRPAIWDM